MTNATKSKQRGDRPSKAERREEQHRAATRQRMLWVGVAAVVGLVVVAAVLLSGGDEGSDGSGAAPAQAVTIDRATGPELTPGDLAPSFSAPGLDGGTVAWSDVQGSPTVLVVWASWCPHCQVELPILVPATQARTGIELISVTTAIGQNPGPTPSDFLADEGLTLATAVDDDAGTLAQGLGVTGFPTVYYVDATGTVVNVTVGESSAGAIEANLDALQPS
jgi:cytochrome c biogenesis protein CcmG/thiol:disulfide interchange protein DsbE